MGRRSSMAFPQPRIHPVKGHLHFRVNGREFCLGKPDSRLADERHTAILATWGANGDTLTLRTEDETLKVRLSGIDTPELGRPFPATGGFDKDLFER